MKKTFIFLTVLLILAFAGGCARGGEESTASDDGGMNVTLTDIEQLKATVPGDGAFVTLLGYNEPNDGGGGLFWYDASSTLEPDGGTVLAPDGISAGRYVRVCEKNKLNVKMFGAKGSGKSDDTAAIQNAVNALKNGGTLVFPGGVYVTTAAISVKTDGIALEGSGEAELIANAAMDAVIAVEGASDVRLDYLKITCNKKAANGVSLTDATDCSVMNCSVTQFTACGLLLDDALNCNFTNVSSYSVSAGVYGVKAMGGSKYDLFNTCSFNIGEAKDGAAGCFSDACELTFQSCAFVKGSPESAGVLFEGAGDGYPYALGFYSCDVTDTEVVEDNGEIGRSYFYAFKTGDGQELPTHKALFGLTDDGRSFGIEALGGNE